MSVFNTDIWSQLAPDAHALMDFFGQNMMWHNSIRQAAFSQGYFFQAMPDSDVVDLKVWLDAHYQEHLNICQALRIAEPPDLSEVDLHDATQLQDWMNLHAGEHQRIHSVLGV